MNKGNNTRRNLLLTLSAAIPKKPKPSDWNDAGFFHCTGGQERYG